MRLRTHLYGINGVASGGTGTLTIPTTSRHHRFLLHVTASGVTAATDIVDYVRLTVNGILLVNLTAEQLIAIAKFNGKTPATGDIPLYFTEPWRKTVPGEESVGLDLSGQSSAVLEVVFKSVTSPAITITDVYDNGHSVITSADGKTQVISYAVIKKLKTSFTATSGINDITIIPITLPIQRLHLIAGTGTITNLEIVADGVKVYDQSKAENDAILADFGLDGTAFGAGAYSFAADYEQQITSPLVPAQNLVVRPTCSAANSMTIIGEYRANGFV